MCYTRSQERMSAVLEGKTIMNTYNGDKLWVGTV